jgi:hypothetical protein
MAYSGQRQIAFQTGFNQALFGRANENPYKKAVVGGSWQAYNDGYADGLISDTPPRGPKGDTGEQGSSGSSGSPGADGSAGLDGNDHLVGSGAPGSGLGADDDIYTDTDNGDIYQKITGSWQLQGSPLGMAQAVRTDTDGASPETIYRGRANPGTAPSAASWRIEEITLAVDGDATILFADGNDSYDNIWNNRAGLSYS